MKAQIKYLLINAVFVICIYYGLFMGNEMAANIAYFIAWITIICSFFALSDEVVKRMAEEGRHGIPVWFDGAFDIAVVLSFVAAGSWFVGIMYLLHKIILDVAWKRAEELKGAKG